MKNILPYLTWISTIAGPVWIILSFVMLYTLLLIQKAKGVYNREWLSVLALIVVCWLHPVYTTGNPLVVELIGNVFTLIFAWIVYLIAKQQLPVPAKYLLPVMIWLFCASIYIGIKYWA